MTIPTPWLAGDTDPVTTVMAFVASSFDGGGGGGEREEEEEGGDHHHDDDLVRGELAGVALERARLCDPGHRGLVLVCGTFDSGGRRTGASPLALLGRYFQEWGVRLADVAEVDRYVRANGAHAARQVRRVAAWSIDDDDDVEGDPVYAAARYALSVLQEVCMRYKGDGGEAYAARVCMAAYLPLVRCYEGGARRVRMEDAVRLVDVEAVVCHATMPNMRRLVERVSFFVKGAKTVRDNNIVRVLEKMFIKAAPLHGHYSDFALSAAKYADGFPSFAALAVMIMRCSLLGLYPTCAAPPGFHAMQCMDRVFPARPRGPMTDAVCMHNFVIFTAFREYMCHVLAGIPSVHTLLCHTYQWAIFESRIHDSMLAIRMACADAVLGRRPGDVTVAMLAPADAVARELNRDTPKSAYQPQTVRFPLLLHHIMRVGRDDPIRRDFVRARAARTTTCHTPVLRHVLRTHYGVSAAGAEAVLRETVAYFLTGVVRPAFVRLFADRLDDDDRRRMCIYCRDLLASQSLSFVPLPPSTRRKQIVAICHRYAADDMPQDGELVRSLLRMTVCTACGEAKTFRTSAGSKACSEDCSFMGSIGVVYNVATNRIECKTCGHGDCLIEVPAVGCVVVMRGVGFLTCTTCGCMTEVDPLAFNRVHYSCRVCTLVIERRRVNSQVFSIPLCPMPGCFTRITRDVFKFAVEVRDDIYVHGRCMNGYAVRPDGNCGCVAGAHHIRKTNIVKTAAAMRVIVTITGSPGAKAAHGHDDCAGDTVMHDDKPAAAAAAQQQQQPAQVIRMFADELNPHGMPRAATAPEEEEEEEDPQRIRIVGFCQKHRDIYRNFVVPALAAAKQHTPAPPPAAAAAPTMVFAGEGTAAAMPALPGARLAVITNRRVQELPPTLSQIVGIIDSAIASERKKRDPNSGRRLTMYEMGHRNEIDEELVRMRKRNRATALATKHRANPKARTATIADMRSVAATAAATTTAPGKRKRRAQGRGGAEEAAAEGDAPPPPQTA